MVRAGCRPYTEYGLLLVCQGRRQGMGAGLEGAGRSRQGVTKPPHHHHRHLVGTHP